MEPVLRPLVYAEPLSLVERHRERGEPVYIVSATLQEIVDAIADDLGFDGALGTVCEVRGRPLHRPRRAGAARRGQGRLRARGRRARGPTTSRSARRTPTATPICRSSKPSAIRSRSTRTASCAAIARRARLAGARVQRARVPARAPPRPAGARGRRRGGRRGAARHEVPWTLTRVWAGCGRSASARPTRRSCGRTSTAPSSAASTDTATRGSRGSRSSRASTRRPSRSCSRTSEGFQRWHGDGAIGYLVLGRSCARSSSDRPRTRGSSSASGRSRPGCSATTSAGSRDGGLVGVLTATSPRAARPSGRRAEARRARIRSRSGSRAAAASRSSPTSRWARSPGATSSRVSGRRTSSSRSAASRRTRRSRSRVGLQLLVDALVRDEGHGAVLLVARPEADPVSGAAGSSPPALAFPAIRSTDCRGKRGSSRIEAKSSSVWAYSRNRSFASAAAARCSSASSVLPARASRQARL